MDRQNAIGYIGSVSWRGSRLGLERMGKLLHALGNPQEKLRFVHVAGTNGKGSVCTMLSSVLIEAGWRTGLYTSPFVGCFNERIQVNRSQITDEDLTRLTGQVRLHADAMEDHPTEFEIVTALGFLYFVEQKCDIVVLEVGLGGRLDATNVIPSPVLAVITSIGLDHTQELGKNIGKITEEKAGIIKPGSEVVASPHPPVAEEKVEAACRRCEAPLHKTDMARLTPGQAELSGQRFVWDGRLELEMPLAGMYQLVNAATALTALEVLARKGFPTDEEAIKKGFLAACWPARLELLRQKPVFFLDGGHNLQGAQVLMQSLRAFYPQRKWVFLVGVMGDKNWRAMMKEALDLAERVICVAPEMERALKAEELAAGIREMKETLPVQTCESVRAGVKAALDAAGEDGLACAFGSLYMAGEIREYFGFGTHHREDFH